MAEYLDEVLTSWTQQTMKDIEILCINDASTDSSLEILNQWAHKDSRIVVHSFENNRSAWVARKWGIEYTTAEYILFADADDTMDTSACEELYLEMLKSPVDILHFNANIINVNQLPEQRIKNMQNFLMPYNGTLHGTEVFTGCFEKKLYQFSLWNKMFRTHVCKQAIQNTSNYFLPKAQDKYLYWAISLNASSYRGIPSKYYYNYYFGRGGTGFNTLSLKQFERYCTMADTANSMHNYLVEKELLEKYAEIDQMSRNALLNDCMTRFRNEIDNKLKGEAFDLLLTKWNTDEIIDILAQKEFYNRYKVARYLVNSQKLKTPVRSHFKTIGTYYHSAYNGGAQRVMCDLCNLFTSMGYNVVVFTDEEPCENDYPLPANAVRIVLPHWQSMNGNNFSQRAKIWETAIKTYHVDVMLYHAWVANTMFWDELVCKLNNVSFIAHCHNIFSLPILKNYDNVMNYMAPYLLADCIVTLSETDQYYWKHFNSNVHVTTNPISNEAKNFRISDSIDKKQILWCGRLSDEKRPEDALLIMKKVIEKEPDAHLHIVGSNPSEKYMNNFQNKIAQMNLSGHVTLHGFHKEVSKFYQNASIFLMTSEYEGFSLTLQESKLSGIPCVMYELPYLSLCEGNRGIIPVETNNTQAAANAIIDLLNNKEKRHEYAKEAKSHANELLNYDFEKKWIEIFSSFNQPHNNDLFSTSSFIMVETLLKHYTTGIRRIKNTQTYQRKISLQKNTLTNRCLYKLIGGLQCCIDHGIGYTLLYAFKKMLKLTKNKAM